MKTRVAAILALPLLAAVACAESPNSRSVPSALDAQGRDAAIILTEWWIFFGISALIFIGVIGLLLLPIIRDARRRPDLQVNLRPSPGLTWVWMGGVALPLIVLSAVLGVSIRNMALLAYDPGEDAMTIEVIGHQWWWEVRYPNEGIVTANEITVPAGETVHLKVTSNDVIHSFWIPQIMGKIDLIPGETHTATLQANNPGVYRGICAEFCGLQHARMHFMLVAHSPDQFEQWVERQRQPAAPPTTDQQRIGHAVFVGRCSHCHTIRGAEALGKVGPDLTHIGSRLTIGAGTLDNRTGALAGWIINPHSIKPGVRMPSNDLTSEELQALLAYLTSLD